MKTKTLFPCAGMFLATTLAAFSQPTIISLQLSGQRANIHDLSHLYLSNSVSPGANVTFTVITASGDGPLSYQWQFDQSDLPGQNTPTLNLPSVQLSNGGDYTVVVTNIAGSTSQVATLTVDPTFTKIITGSIVTDAGYSAGGAWGDYNNDGFLDLFVPNGNGEVRENNFMYRNNANGSFSKIISGPPINSFGDWLAACWGDYDNDGSLDLFVGGFEQRLLYRNDGNGTFTRVLTGSVVTDVTSGQGSLGCAWGDYNSDGLLDLYVTTFSFAGNAHNFLYRNNGDGTFTRISNGSIVTDLGSFSGCAWGDYDNDGNSDLFVSSESGNNSLFHNSGDGTFTKVTPSTFTHGGHSGGCAWGDYDNDGFLDLFVANGTFSGSENNFLYHNNGNGTFTRITNAIPGTDGGKSISCAWGDYDNDAFLDLFVTNEGGPLRAPTVVNFLYHNNGDGTFTKVITGSLVNEYSDSFGCSWADYDNDGFLDLFVARGDDRGNFLYRNNGNSNSWITIKPVGTVSNRSAIGAKVRVEALTGGVRQRQLREISGGNGCNGQSALWANFGLGDATNIDLVRIEWPSGIVQTMTNVVPKKILTVVEHQEPGAVTVPAFTSVSRSTSGATDLSVAGDAGLLYLFEASTNLVNWSWLGVRTNLTGNIQFSDTSATNFPKRFYRVSVP